MVAFSIFMKLSLVYTSNLGDVIVSLLTPQPEKELTDTFSAAEQS